MAKKKGKREEGFTFPEFDKEEFRQKELRDSKVILFAVFYALVIAVVSYYLVRMTSLERSVVLFGFIAPFGLIKILPMIVDTSEFERKNWFGPMFMSSWLGWVYSFYFQIHHLMTYQILNLVLMKYTYRKTDNGI